MSSNQDTDLSFLEKKDANSLSGKDIFYTIVRNLHWLILCAIIGAAIRILPPEVVVFYCLGILDSAIGIEATTNQFDIAD